MKNLRLWLPPLEYDTDSPIMLNGGLLVVFLIDSYFLTLKNNVIVTKTNFQLYPESLRPHTFMIQKQLEFLNIQVSFQKATYKNAIFSRGNQFYQWELFVCMLWRHELICKYEEKYMVHRSEDTLNSAVREVLP